MIILVARGHRSGMTCDMVVSRAGQFAARRANAFLQEFVFERIAAMTLKLDGEEAIKAVPYATWRRCALRRGR